MHSYSFEALIKGFYFLFEDAKNRSIISAKPDRSKIESRIKNKEKSWSFVVEMYRERAEKENTPEVIEKYEQEFVRAKKEHDAEISLWQASLDEIDRETVGLIWPQEKIENILDSFAKEVDKFSSTLSLKRRQFEYIDEYGAVENKRWMDEVYRFVKRNPKVSDVFVNLSEIVYSWGGQIVGIEKLLVDYVDSVIDASDPELHSPALDGKDFERLCLENLLRQGFEASLTLSTGDQGVDIIAKIPPKVIAIQCKFHASPIGNSAVQEVFAGCAFYDADVAIVISSSGFTSSAIELASKLRVRLLDYAALNKISSLV